jgi:hypothetical protein
MTEAKSKLRSQICTRELRDDYASLLERGVALDAPKSFLG